MTNLRPYIEEVEKEELERDREKLKILSKSRFHTDLINKMFNDFLDEYSKNENQITEQETYVLRKYNQFIEAYMKG